MSAFIVSHKHINAIITFLYSKQAQVKADDQYLDLHYIDNCQLIAEILLAENVRSINARYPDTIGKPENMPGRIDEVGKPIKFKFEILPVEECAVQILKACQCYDYQACETDDYEQSRAAQIINLARTLAISSLPGYEDAQWEIK